MRLKPAIALYSIGLLLAGFPAAAQNQPQNNWDIAKIDVSKLPPASDKKGVTYEKDILPIFKESCVRCHGEQPGGRAPRAGLRLDNLDTALKGGRDGKVIVPGDSKKSLLVAAVARINDNIAMPPAQRGRRGGPGGQARGAAGTNAPASTGAAGGPAAPSGLAAGTNQPPQGRGGPQSKPITAEQVGLIRAWIDQGAK